MEKNILIFAILFFFLPIKPTFSKIKRPSTVHKVFFKGTEYQLDVYQIYGRKNGKTLLIIGGIQGDEPGGYLSADLYSNLKLYKGNLIVIPRANLKSIILFKRGPDGDMNRRFHLNKDPTKMGKVVKVLKSFIKQADIFLHLHDGWGFHYPKYIDKLRNNRRFGQSIIIDTEKYTCNQGKTLYLKNTALKVLKLVNKKIDNPKYFLHLFNTKTFSPDTPFKEMRKSATFYALTHYCIPSFAIETSKNLPSLEMKIRIHNYAINEFMKIYGIEPEYPPIITIKPKIEYCVVEINGIPQVFNNNDKIFINKYDEIKIVDIVANYKTGITCDILGYGNLNDINKKFKILQDTLIIFRKEQNKIGKIFIKVLKNFNQHKKLVFLVKINNKPTFFLPGETINITPKDVIELVGVFSLGKFQKKIKLNLKGFIPPNTKLNIGDDRGYRINISSSHFIKKYSINGKGKIYPIEAKIKNKKIGVLWLKIEN